MLDFIANLIKYGLILILLVAFFQAFVTHLILIYEFKIKQHHDKKINEEHTEEIPFLFIVKSFFIECCCNALVLLMLPFANLPYRNTNINENPDHATPILLIHGYLHNQTDWFWFRTKLIQDHKLGPVYSLNLPEPLGSIITMAEALRHKIEEIKQETGQSRVILIGHSMGGLVASYYSEYLANEGEIAKLITLGSPFQGTKLSVFGRGENITQMLPNSLFLEELHTRMQNTRTSYFFVASKIDNVVIPWQSSLPPHIAIPNTNIMILEDHGHNRLLISNQVIQKVGTWITENNIH